VSELPELPEGVRDSVPTLDVELTAEMLGIKRAKVFRLLDKGALKGKKHDGQWRVSTRSIASELYWRTETMHMPLPSARFGTRPLRSFTAFEHGLGLWTSRWSPRALVSADGDVVELIVPTDQEVEFWDQYLRHL
jgi:hypothetical protein